MIHARRDYNAIQAWPQKREHWAKDFDAGQPGGLTVDLSDVPDDEVGPEWGVSYAPIIPEDEPVFLIRSKDIVGPTAVRAWAHLAEEAGTDPELVAHVRAFATKMAEYAEANGGSKVPDAPEGALQ